MDTDEHQGKVAPSIQNVAVAFVSLIQLSQGHQWWHRGSDGPQNVAQMLALHWVELHITALCLSARTRAKLNHSIQFTSSHTSDLK